MTAHGSMITTTNTAIANAREIAKFLPNSNASANVNNINSVRCVGTDMPANTAYKIATSNPKTVAALRAGIHITKLGTRRHTKLNIANAKPASIVMCKPEIDMR